MRIKNGKNKAEFSTSGRRMCKFIRFEPRFVIIYPYLCKLFKKHYEP